MLRACSVILVYRHTSIPPPSLSVPVPSTTNMSMSVSAATTQGGGSSHLPKCCAIASRSKQQCQKHIENAGTYFCKYHRTYTGTPVPDAVQAVNAWLAAQLSIAATASTSAAPMQQPLGQRPPAVANYAAIPLPDSPPPSEAVMHQPSGSAMSVSRMPLPQIVPQPQPHVGYPISPALAQHGIRFEHGILKVPHKLSAAIALLRDILPRIGMQAEFVVLPPSTPRR